jgi:hypothetical protein
LPDFVVSVLGMAGARGDQAGKPASRLISPAMIEVRV